MKPGSKHWRLPERFILRGKSLSSDLQHPDQGWILLRDQEHPTGLIVESYPHRPGNHIRISNLYHQNTDQEHNHSRPVPEIEGFSSDWIEIITQPLKDIMIRTIFWVPDPQILCCQIKIKNLSAENRQIDLKLAGVLQSGGRGNQIALDEYQGRPLLTGNLDKQALALFLVQNAVSNNEPYPYLSTALTLSSMDEVDIQWFCILATTKMDAFASIEKVLRLDWAGEIANRKVSREGYLEIETGDPNWDLAMALSQKQAELIYHQIGSLDWGMTPLQAILLIESIQPLSPEIINQILNCVFGEFLQEEDRQDQEIIPAFFSTELLWQIYQSGGDIQTLSIYLEIASKWILSWFSSRFDKDQDGIPELGDDLDLNLFGSGHNHLESGSELIPYPYLESPGVGAVLYNDLSKLENLSQITGVEIDPAIPDLKAALLEFLKESWSEENQNYLGRDYLSHQALDGYLIKGQIQPGFTIINEKFQESTRIGIRHQKVIGETHQSKFEIIFRGQDLHGKSRVEEIVSSDLYLGNDLNWGVTESVFSKLESCSLRGYVPGQTIDLFSPRTGHNQITDLLPLWAVSLPENLSDIIINDLLLNPEQYWSQFGFCSNPGPDGSDVHISINLLLGQALMNYGRSAEVVNLIERLLSAQVPAITRTGNFYPEYHPVTGKGVGKINQPDSLIPIRFFLKALGIEFVRNNKIAIRGQNPFPWPITVSYRGVKIERGFQETRITKPGREMIRLDNPENFELELN